MSLLKSTYLWNVKWFNTRKYFSIDAKKKTEFKILKHVLDKKKKRKQT